jgi:hypothetical protein
MIHSLGLFYLGIKAYICASINLKFPMKKIPNFPLLLIGAILGIFLVTIIDFYKNPHNNVISQFIPFSTSPIYFLERIFSALASLQLLLLSIRWVFGLEKEYDTEEISLLNYLILGFSIIYVGFFVMEGDFRNTFLIGLGYNVLLSTFFLVPKFRNSILWTIIICFAINLWPLVQWFLLTNFMKNL